MATAMRRPATACPPPAAADHEPGTQRAFFKCSEVSEDMPRAWTDKDERQYEHIKESSLERGVNENKAEEIAARTVNKHRRVEGRTPNARTQGTGNPNRSLDERSRDEVYNR